jgi:type IV pilus assembly protein PilW
VSPLTGQYSGSPIRQRGMTLVELMVAMVLGLIFIGGAVSLTLANRRSYSTNEGLSQVQEGGRTAFELLARDIRQAGISGCDNSGRIANVLDTTAGTEWWQAWFGIRGYGGAQASTGAAFGATRGDRVAGTDSIQTQGIQGLGLTVESHDPVAADLLINAGATDIVTGDVMIACDFDHATIFQVSSYDAGNVALTHNIGVAAPGNCSAGLGFPTVCTATGTAYAFVRNSLLGRFGATEWYIGRSGRATDSGRSLFRRRLGNGGVEVTEEVVADVTEMVITYRVGDADEFEAAPVLAAGDWADVNAVRIELTVNSADARVSTDASVNNGRLERSFTQVIALRNRVP